MQIIGLTGGIGCGKTTVAKILESSNSFYILDADQIARDVSIHVYTLLDLRQ